MVKKGDEFEIERQESPLKLDVLMYSSDSDVKVGNPVLSDVEVIAEIKAEKRGRKVRVARFRSKSRYRKVKGHKQPLSVIEIKDISVKGARPAKAAASKPTAAKTAKVVEDIAALKVATKPVEAPKLAEAVEKISVEKVEKEAKK
jgi:large subunit ribosomal protein L21